MRWVIVIAVIGFLGIGDLLYNDGRTVSQMSRYVLQTATNLGLR